MESPVLTNTCMNAPSVEVDEELHCVAKRQGRPVNSHTDCYCRPNGPGQGLQCRGLQLQVVLDFKAGDGGGGGGGGTVFLFY